MPTVEQKKFLKTFIEIIILYNLLESEFKSHLQPNKDTKVQQKQSYLLLD